MEKARKIYNEMILDKANNNKFSSVWLEFYDLEKQFGDEKHQRKLLYRALNDVSNNDEKEIIYDHLHKFEKLNGNINQFNNFYTKYEQFMQQRRIELAQLAESNKKNNKKKEVTEERKPFQQKSQKDQQQSKRPNQQVKDNIKEGKGNENNLKRKVCLKESIFNN